MANAPLAEVKSKYESKEGLIKAVKALITPDLWIDRLSSKGLERVSSRKLIHLQQVLTQVKTDFGSREALIGAILKLENREKDQGYRTRLERFSTPKLASHHRATSRRGNQPKAGPKAAQASKKSAQA